MSQLSIDGDDTAGPLIPERPSLKKLREAAAGCKACPLWETGTQTVLRLPPMGSTPFSFSV